MEETEAEEVIKKGGALTDNGRQVVKVVMELVIRQATNHRSLLHLIWPM